MTILSLINADGSGKDLDVTDLFAQVKDLTSVDLLALLPSVHLSQGYYTNIIQGALLAALQRLRARQEIKSKREIFKPERELTAEELELKPGSMHNITTINDVAWIRMNVPVYEDDPALTPLVDAFNAFIDFLKEGYDTGADLANSDYPETPVETVAPEETVVEPVAAPIETVEAVENAEPTVEDGIPEEALVPVEAS